MTKITNALVIECKNHFFDLRKERISTQCVCCGSEVLVSSPAILMPFIAHRVFDWSPIVIDESWGLKTIANGNAYSICKSLYCSDCGLLYCDIRFSDAESSKLYDGYRGKEYNGLREFYEPGYTARSVNINAGVEYISDIEKFLTPHLNLPITILDWGGGTGKNTPFKKSNTAFDIYDVNKKEVADGANVVSKNEAFSKKYQLIVCSNVIEHVSYPSDLLFDILNVMNNDSVLYIETPLENIMAINEINLYTKKKHWHEHINFFSEKSLRKLFENVGLDVIDLAILRATAGGQSSHLFQVACKLK